MQIPSPTWFVGCGNMAGAMLAGWRAAGVDLSNAVAIRPSGTPVEGVRTVSSIKEAGAAPSMVVLGFKPQKLDEVAPELEPWLTSKTIVVSLLAGAEAESLRRRFKTGVIVRAMPNLPVAVRRGVVALYAHDDLPDSQHKQVSDLFSALGFAMWTESETAFGAVGSVAGSGPAYVARFVDALAAAAVNAGLPEGIARTIAIETVLGTGWMAAASDESMTELARRVASPNGTTEAGLELLDRDSALGALIGRTIEAARKRGAELAAEARGEELA